jgi:peptide/nickel transport system permease protein
MVAPGSDVDARTMDARLSDSSIAAIVESRGTGQWLQRLLTGDLGESSAYGRPVAELIRERIGVTAELVSVGLSAAWLSALAALFLALAFRSAALDAMLAAISGATISQPAALLALFCLYAELPAAVAIAILLAPQVFAYLRNLTDRILDEPHVFAAHSRGVPHLVVIGRHVLLRAAPAALGMLGVSMSIAVGAAVPIEVICDLPGIGQLIWEAALSRDLPLIVALTAVVAFVTIAANFAADAAGEMTGAETE